MNCLILHARDPTGNSGSGIGSGSGTTLITSGTDAGLGFGTITSDTKDEDDGVRDTTRAKDISTDSGSERMGVGTTLHSGKGVKICLAGFGNIGGVGGGANGTNGRGRPSTVDFS